MTHNIKSIIGYLGLHDSLDSFNSLNYKNKQDMRIKIKEVFKEYLYLENELNREFIEIKTQMSKSHNRVFHKIKIKHMSNRKLQKNKIEYAVEQYNQAINNLYKDYSKKMEINKNKISNKVKLIFNKPK